MNKERVKLYKKEGNLHMIEYPTELWSYQFTEWEKGNLDKGYEKVEIGLEEIVKVLTEKDTRLKVHTIGYGMDTHEVEYLQNYTSEMLVKLYEEIDPNWETNDYIDNAREEFEILLDEYNQYAMYTMLTFKEKEDIISSKYASINVYPNGIINNRNEYPELLEVFTKEMEELLCK